jgi:N-acyl homoserine lactone hydrolase
MPTPETVLQGFSTQTDQGGLGFCAVTLLRGEKLTLVDVGHVGRRALLLEKLHAAGIAPEQVERVVLTHGHWDHSLNVDCFPNAELVLHEAELEYLRDPHPLDWATPVWIARLLDGRTVTTVRDGDEIDAGVRVMATPGHSRGSLTLLLDTPDGVTGLVGDALPNRASAGFLAPRLVFWDEQEARASARRIVDTCRFIHPGHDRPFRVENGAFHYLEPTAINLIWPPTDEEGRVLAAISDQPPATGPTIVPSARRMQPAGGSDA